MDLDELMADDEVAGRAGGDYLEDVFGPGGHLARAFVGYERREEQVQVARRVDASIRQGVPALCEAPTGTGKSLAYLVPLAYHLSVGRADLLARRKEPEPREGDLDDLEDDREGPAPRPRALIATANIALQEQVLRKDVPALRQALPWPFTAAMAKGRANYLCLDRMDDTAAELVLEPLRDYGDREQWLEVMRWAAHTQRGDFSELPFELRPTLKPKLAVSSDDCIGRTCPRRDECWSQRAKKDVEQADVIVANYHLLFAHLALSREGARLLPRFDVVILDEAHAAADIARDFFGFRVSPGAIRHAARLLVQPKKASPKKGFMPTIDSELRAEIDRMSDRLFSELRDHRRSPQYHARLTEPNVVDAAPLVEALRKTSTLYSGTAERGEAAPPRCAELRRAARRARILAGDLERAVKCQEEGSVFFIEEEERGNGIPSRVTLCGAPLDPAPILRETLFESPELIATVATSATLATSRNADAFDYAVRQMGADAAEELLVGSPFDLPKQALIIVPSDAPDPKRKDFAERLAPMVVHAIELARGRTLALFTSRRGLKVASEAVRAELGDRYLVLVQGDAPRTQLMDRFRKDVSSVLLGTRSFWAGVDVPGESLSCVLIDRVPFDSPEDPIADAMDEKLGRKCFVEWAIPRAAIELRQGFGRLIRSRGDRGVVVLFDKRLATQGWGKKILRALPDCPRSDDLEDVGRFLDARPEPAPEPVARPTRSRSDARRSA